MRSGVEEIWTKRPAADIQAAIKQIAALQQGTAPTAPPAGAAAPPPQEMAGATPPPPTTSIREFLGR